MTDAGDAALRHRAHADAVFARAGGQLRELLRSLASGLDPFPEFPGSFFSYGIEAEPAAVGAGRGCVVLGEDGELYELQVGAGIDQLDTDDPAAGRSELRLPLDGLAPAEYLQYAVSAASAALAAIEARAAE